MLNEEYRVKLQNLINEAEEKGEDSSFIQNELIPAFKTKYDKPPAPVESTLMNRMLDRAASVDNPTKIGKLLGTDNGSTVDAIVGTPERAVRMLGGAINNLTDIGITPLAKIGKAILPESATRAIESGIGSAVNYVTPDIIKRGMQDPEIAPTLAGLGGVASVAPIGSIASKAITKALPETALNAIASTAGKASETAGNMAQKIAELRPVRVMKYGISDTFSPLASVLESKPFSVADKAVSAIANVPEYLSKGAESYFSARTGIPKETLRAISTPEGRKIIEDAGQRGVAYETGQKLLSNIEGADLKDYLKESNGRINQAIENTGDVSANDALAALKKVKDDNLGGRRGKMPEGIQASRTIDKMMDAIANPDFHPSNYSTQIADLTKGLNPLVTKDVQGSLDALGKFLEQTDPEKALSSQEVRNNLLKVGERAKSRLRGVQTAESELPDIMQQNRINSKRGISDATEANIRKSYNTLNGRIDGLINKITEDMQPAGTMSANEMLDLRRFIDKKIPYGKDMSGVVDKARFAMRDAMGRTLEKAAPPEYAQDMAYVHNILSAADDVKEGLRSNPERYVNTLFNKGNTDKILAIKHLDQQLGTDFYDQIENIHHASALGNEGRVNLISQGSHNGKSLLPLIGGTAFATGLKTGSAPLMALGATSLASHSPYVASRVIGGLRKLPDLINEKNLNPALSKVPIKQLY